MATLANAGRELGPGRVAVEQGVGHLGYSDYPVDLLRETFTTYTDLIRTVGMGLCDPQPLDRPAEVGHGYDEATRQSRR